MPTCIEHQLGTRYVLQLIDPFPFRGTKAKGDVLIFEVNLGINLWIASELLRKFNSKNTH